MDKKTKKSESNIIQVSFRKEEVETYHEIKLLSKPGTISGWVKDAILMKLDYERNRGSYQYQYDNPRINQDTPIMNQPSNNSDPLPFNVDNFLDSF